MGRDNKEHIAYTASWGILTRLIGGIIMSHASDDGLVLLSQIAPYQVVIIPIIHDNSQATEINNYCAQIREKLDNSNIRIYIDSTETSTPNKIWKWVKKKSTDKTESRILRINK